MFVVLLVYSHKRAFSVAIARQTKTGAETRAAASTEYPLINGGTADHQSPWKCARQAKQNRGSVGVLAVLVLLIPSWWRLHIAWIFEKRKLAPLSMDRLVFAEYGYGVLRTRQEIDSTEYNITLQAYLI